MKIKDLTFILTFLSVLPAICVAQVSSLDEIYRGIVKADNQDYLPLFVKNRQTPNFLKDVENIEAMSASQKDETIDLEKIVNLENQEKIANAKKKAEELKWQAIILSVQQNKVTPFEIEEIQKRVDNNNPQATEIFAFMNAKGIGLEPDFIKSFLLYQKALNLGVKNAKENAILVYNSMSVEQKRKLKSTKY